LLYRLFRARETGARLERGEPVREERRSFLTALVLTPLAPAALAGSALAQAPAAPAAEPPAPPASGTDAVAEALAEAVRREHPADLDAASVGAVKKEIARSLEAARRMRSALHLGNADEPVTWFTARGRR
jgi:hypothetical protein